MKILFYLAIMVVGCQPSKDPSKDSQSPGTPNTPIELPPSDDNNGSEKSCEELIEEINDSQYWKDTLRDMIHNTFWQKFWPESETKDELYKNRCLVYLGYRVAAARNLDLELDDLKFFVKCYNKFDEIIQQTIDEIIDFHKKVGIYSNNFSIKVYDLNKVISSLSESTLSKITKLLGDKIAQNINEQLKKNFKRFTVETHNINFDLKKLQNIFKKINEQHSCHLECNDNSINDIQNSVKQFAELDVFNNISNIYYTKDGVNFSQITEVLPEVKTGDKYEIVKFDPHEDDGFITCIITDNVGKYYRLDNGYIDYRSSTIKFLQNVYFDKGAFIGM